MLVLTRKLQQQIKIGDQITVTVLRVKGSTVRIGVQAPREMRVIRGELPKVDATAEEASTEVIELPMEVGVVELGATEAAEEAAEAACPIVATAAIEPASSQGPKAGHLPLRKLRQRRGTSPLKQMVAACGALAK